MTDSDMTREQLMEEVTALRARVAELDERFRREFVNFVIDLRNPVVNIKLYAHLLKGLSDKDSERRDKYLAGITDSIRLLEELFEYMLEWSYWVRLQAGNRDPVRFDSVDLSAMVESVATRWSSDRLTLTFTTQPDLPSAHTIAGYLGQVLGPILANAVTYTTDGGEVTVTTGTKDTDDGQWVGFTVSDTGPGIPPDELPHVFEPYFRGEAARDLSRGTGLGLTIAKRVVDLLQGRIELTSQGIPGEGTTVSVWLPVAEQSS